MKESWFKTEVLRNKVIAFGEPHHDQEVFSYLVGGSERDLLIDTGMGVENQRVLLENFRQPEKELIVINSHSHFDHIGGNRFFPEVFVPRNEWENFNIRRGWDRNYMLKNRVVAGFLPEAKGIVTRSKIERYNVPGYESFRSLLTEDCTIDLGDRVLRVLETPGHTPGGISLYEEESGLLFSADILYRGPLYAHLEGSSVSDYLHSLLRLLDMGDSIKIIHPGHNYSSEKPNLINEALMCLRRAIDKEKSDETRDGVAIYKHDKIQRLSVVVKS